MQRSSTLLIRETQTKTTMRHHLTPVRTAVIKKSRNNKCWRGCWKKGTLAHCWRECKLLQPLWNTKWRFHKKLKLEWPQDLAVPLSGVQPKKIKTLVQKDARPTMFTAALLLFLSITKIATICNLIATICNQHRCPSANSQWNIT